MKLTITILVCVVVALIIIMVLTGLAFNAGFKRDGKKDDIHYIWNDRRRNWLGLPWSFTKYFLSEDRLFIQRGLIRTQYDEVRLYRVLDVKMTETLWNKLTKCGTITVHSSDKTMGTFDITNIKKPKEIKELLSEQVENQRDKHRVYSREDMHDEHGMPDEHDDFHDGPDMPDFDH